MKTTFASLRLVILLIFLLLVQTVPSHALPSFAEQTGQPCAACHVGAFGPQLTQFGREFKLYGYISTEGKPWKPPISAMAQLSFTNTEAGQNPPQRWYASNNNVSFDQASLYYAGKIYGNTGAFIELNYDGIAHQLQPGNADIRHAQDYTWGGIDLVGGITINNSPTVQDLWNSTPVWGFPYISSKLAPSPLASAQIDNGTLGSRVLGVGLYALWEDLLYTELTAYRGVGRDVMNATGIVPVAGAPGVDGFIPYWRIAVQKNLTRHFFQIGTYGMIANIFPGGSHAAGTSDNYTDLAVDANYQFVINPKSVVSDLLSAHATLIHETQTLGASSRLMGTNGSDSLDTARADVSYSIGATVTPSIQVFHISGSMDPVQFTTPNGRPNSSGAMAEIAYVPWGKPDSPVQFMNLRFAASYVAYTQFNGTSHGAAANNTLYLSLWGAMHF